MRAPTARLLRALRPSAPPAAAAAAVTGRPATCLSRRCISSFSSSSSSSSPTPSRLPTQYTPVHLSQHHRHNPPLRPFSTTPTTPSKKNAKTTTPTTPTPTTPTTPRRAAPNRPPVTTEDVPDADVSDSPLNALNVFADMAAPTTAIDACLDDGFHLNNGVKVMGGDGCLLVDGEVFRWRPWEGSKVGDKVGERGAMVNEKGQWEVPEEAWGVLKLVWPKPGLGGSVRPISPETRRHINLLGIRVEVQDTRNAAAQFNLLATERGVREVAAAMIPIGWRG
ncbi:hypothetical protein FQN55_005440 [Onygenales sp. PD_40]|nr:hypothetical protein FQN55_005440 [Onygenales sp. PD_40]